MPLAHTQRPSTSDSHAIDNSMNQQYDTLMAHFAAGEHGRVELGAGEDRVAVREMLQAAAQRRDLQLTFRRGRGPLTFRVEALQKPAKRAAQRSEASAIPVEAIAPAPAVATPVQEAASERPTDTPHKPVRPRKAVPAPAQRPAPQQNAEPSKAAAPAPVQQVAPDADTNRPRPQPRAQRAPEQRGTRGPEQRSTRGPEQRSTRGPEQRASSTNRRNNADTRRKSDERRPGNSRYDDMLPRWMREGERPAGQTGRSRGDGKRRTRS